MRLLPFAFLALSSCGAPSCDPDADLEHVYSAWDGGKGGAAIASGRGGSAEQTGGSTDAGTAQAFPEASTDATPAVSSSGGSLGAGGNAQIKVGVGGDPWPAMTGNPDYHPPLGGAPGAGGAPGKVGASSSAGGSDAGLPLALNCQPGNNDRCFSSVAGWKYHTAYVCKSQHTNMLSEGCGNGALEFNTMMCSDGICADDSHYLFCCEP